MKATLSPARPARVTHLFPELLERLVALDHLPAVPYAKANTDAEMAIIIPIDPLGGRT